MMDRIPVVKIPVRSGCSLTLPVFLTESGKGFHHRGQVMSLNTQKKPVIPEHPGPTGFVSLKESSHCYVEVSIGNLLRLLDRFRQFRQEVEDVRFDAHVRHLKYGGFGILVNGDDKGASLDSTQVLEGAADAAPGKPWVSRSGPKSRPGAISQTIWRPRWDGSRIRQRPWRPLVPGRSRYYPHLRCRGRWRPVHPPW